MSTAVGLDTMVEAENKTRGLSECKEQCGRRKVEKEKVEGDHQKGKRGGGKQEGENPIG